MAEVVGNHSPESGIDMGPKGPELIFDKGGPIRRISRFIRGIILAAGGAGAVLSACTPGTDSPNKPAGIYGTQTGALNLTQVPNIGPGQQIPWSIPVGGVYNYGETYVGGVYNYGEINDEKYLFFANVVDEGGVAYVQGQTIEKGGATYVKGKTMEDCLSANANIQKVQGLIAAGLPHEIECVYYGESPDEEVCYDQVYAGASGVFQDADGDDKFLVDSEGGVYQCDIASNSDTVLEVANCAVLDPPMFGDFSIFKKNGHPYALWEGYGSARRDLQAGKDEKLDINWTGNCGFGFEGDTDFNPATYGPQGVVGVEMFDKENWWDPVKCRLSTAKNWQEFNDNPVALDVLNQGLDNVRSPRLADNYLLYIRHDNFSDGSCCHHSPWYVPIPLVPQDPEPDANQPDVVEIEEPDAIDGTETEAPDATNQDTGPEVPLDIGSDLPPKVDVAMDSQPSLDTSPEIDSQSDVTAELPPVIDAGSDLPPKTDTNSDTPQPQPDATAELPPVIDAGSDLSPESDAELEITPDEDALTTEPLAPPKTSEDSGCNAGLNSPSSSPETAALMLSAMALLAMYRRRTWNRVARSFKSLGLRS